MNTLSCKLSVKLKLSFTFQNWAGDRIEEKLSPLHTHPVGQKAKKKPTTK